MENKFLYSYFDHWFTNSDNVWLYSDPHFGDIECYALRVGLIDAQDKNKYSREQLIEKFPTIVEDCEKFDEMQIKNINRTVGKKGTFICLGDVGDVEYVKRIRANYKVLILGNHDSGKSNYKKTVVFEKIVVLGRSDVNLVTKNAGLFDEVVDGALTVNAKLILSHEPIVTPYYFNIHGHDHSGWYTNDCSLNVCAEHINYTPVSLITLLKNGLTSNVASIHRQAIDKAIERRKNKEEDE